MPHPFLSLSFGSAFTGSLKNMFSVLLATLDARPLLRVLGTGDRRPLITLGVGERDVRDSETERSSSPRGSRGSISARCVCVGDVRLVLRASASESCS
jgi:hypothetical protein